METITRWLDRLRQAKPEELREYSIPVFAPGFQGLDLEDCIITVEPREALPQRIGDTSPVSMGILRYVDLAQDEPNQQLLEELTGELAALLSLVAERRVTIPKVVPIRVPNGRCLFLAYGSAADQRLHGPIAQGLEPFINDILTKIAGLPTDVCRTIGAAVQLHHSAIELFEIDLRAAYLLLVAGIEVLSRAFGNPPNDWSSWESSTDWENNFSSASLTEDQKTIIRNRLMENKHLRLKATFREYGSTRVPDSFWDEKWENWMYGNNGSTGTWLPAHSTDARVIRDILPHDRKLLSSLLANSYDARSGLVHNGLLLKLMENAIPVSMGVDPKRPLPFPVLRSLLRCLIRFEVDTRTSSATLPPIRLLQPRAKHSAD